MLRKSASSASVFTACLFLKPSMCCSELTHRQYAAQSHPLHTWASLESTWVLTSLSSGQPKPVVLQVVPVVFFELLDAVVALHQNQDLSLPERLEKTELKDRAHLAERAELMRLVQKAAAYSCNLKAFDRCSGVKNCTSTSCTVTSMSWHGRNMVTT